MTGAPTWDQLSWIIGLIITAGTIVTIFLGWVYTIVSGLRREFSTAAQLEKERAKLMEDELRRDLAEYKLHVAEKYATKDGVTAAVGRMEVAIEKLSAMVHDSVERITNRMDRLLDGRDQQTTRRTPRGE